MTQSFRNSQPAPPIMQGTPVPPEWRIPAGGYDAPPHNRWSFQNMRQIAPSVDVRRGDDIWDLPRDLQDIGAVSYTALSGRSETWDEMLERSYTDASLIWLDGKVIHESYFNGMDRRTQHVIYSMSKSLTSVVAGCLVHDGLLDLAAPVTEYAPELARTAWKGATVQQVLDMTTGAVFDETYDDPAAEVWKLDIAAGLRPAPPDMPPDEVPGCIHDLILSLTRSEAPHGARFSYRSIETEVLSLVMERAEGRHLAPMMSERLWAPVGAEEDGFFTVDRAGFVLSDGGFNGTLRDMARFARLMLEDGVRDGRQIVPAEWITDIRSGDHGMFDAHGRELFPDGRYRNMFWIPDRTRPAHMCLGIHGQQILIDPDRALFAVKLSSWPTALSEEGYVNDWMLALDAVVDAFGRTGGQS